MFKCGVNKTKVHLRFMMGSRLRGGRISVPSYLCTGRRRVLQNTYSTITTRKNSGREYSKPFSAIKREDVITGDPHNNVSDYIYQRLGINLHQRPDHPLGILKNVIGDYFDSKFGNDTFKRFDDIYPIVSTFENFDSVLVPKDHISRSVNDTYYVNADSVLRCHTSAHQHEKLKSGEKQFLITGDVYRRDTIDATHFPVFHQMEGVRVFEASELNSDNLSEVEVVSKELKETLEGLAQHLFGEVEMRWVDAYFPFTEPSYELEIYFNGEWLEVLGCGVMQQSILDDSGNPGKKAWAFGLGLERLAMVLFDIPDIRLFWSDDPRFSNQFRAQMFRAGGLGMKKFKSYSKYPPCLKDVSFWLPENLTNFTENNLCELVRGIAGNLVEEVKLIDEFHNSKTGKTSNCFRIVYRSMERSLTDEEVNELQDSVRRKMVEELGVTLR